MKEVINMMGFFEAIVLIGLIITSIFGLLWKLNIRTMPTLSLLYFGVIAFITGQLLMLIFYKVVWGPRGGHTSGNVAYVWFALFSIGLIVALVVITKNYLKR